MPTRDEIEAAASEILKIVSVPNIVDNIERWYAIEKPARTVADAFLSHPYGTLKPLRWVDAGKYWRAETIFGVGYVYEHKWFDCDDIQKACDSVEHGKNLFMDYYAAEMAKAFTKIGGGE